MPRCAGDGEGLVALPDSASLPPGAIFVLARRALAYRSRFGVLPDAEWEDSDPAVPDLARLRQLPAADLPWTTPGMKWS